MSNVKQVDIDNPEWTESMLQEATTLDASALPNAFKVAVKKGRPVSDNPKQPISIRLSTDVLEYFRATGKGWQTRVDAVLHDYVKHHK